MLGRSVTSRFASLVVVLALGAGACGSATAPQRDLVVARDQSPVQTDSVSYALVRRPSEYRAFAFATYRNATGAPVYFARCGRNDTLPMFGISRTGSDSTRRLFQDWAWACVGGVPAGTIMPGQSVTVRVQLGSVDQPNMSPPLRPEDIVGQLRIQLSLCTKPNADSDAWEFLPQSDRTSNAFTVHY